MRGKNYKIKYILSNDKIITHENKRKKIMEEWDEVLQLTHEEIIKFLKLGKKKNKDKDILVDEIILIDKSEKVVINNYEGQKEFAPVVIGVW